MTRGVQQKISHEDLKDIWEGAVQAICGYLKDVAQEPWKTRPLTFAIEARSPDNHEAIAATSTVLARHVTMIGSTCHFLNDLFSGGPRQDSPYKEFQPYAVEWVGALLRETPLIADLARQTGTPNSFIKRLRRAQEDAERMLAPVRSEDWFVEAYNKHGNSNANNAA